MGVYSFVDNNCVIAGPFFNVSVGAGSGSAEEGIEIDWTDDKNTMQTGADGEGQHNLHASKSARVTFRFLKTSPRNAVFQNAYNAQTTSAAFHGQNTFSLRNPVSGDAIDGLKGAFVKQPKNAYAKDGPTMEWMFDFIKVHQKLGNGGPAF